MKTSTKIKRFLKQFIKDWNAKTPKVWLMIRNIAGAVTIGLPSAMLFIERLPHKDFPDVFWEPVIIISFISAFITAVAGKQKTNDLPTENS